MENVNLAHEYDKLNQLIFKGKLIQPKLVWANCKRRGGFISGIRNINTKEVTIEKIAISKFYNYTHDQVIAILCHEMIHQYILVNNIHEIGGQHGLMFKNLVKLCKEKGVDVPLSDNYNASVNNIKNNIVILCIDKNYNLISSSISNEKNINNFRTDIEIKRKRYKVYIISTNNPIIYRIKSSRKYLTFYKITNDVANDILKNGQKIDFK